MCTEIKKRKRQVGNIDGHFISKIFKNCHMCSRIIEEKKLWDTLNGALSEKGKALKLEGKTS